MGELKREIKEFNEEEWEKVRKLPGFLRTKKINTQKMDSENLKKEQEEQQKQNN